jgi:hypothetical protein
MIVSGFMPESPFASVELERTDTQGFLGEILRILPLLGVRFFEKPTVVASKEVARETKPSAEVSVDTRDTVVVPAQEDRFEETFIDENCWYYIRISGGMLPRIKYCAAYRTATISAITHYAPVESIEAYGDGGGSID